jgi:hypothetical protein
MAYTAANLTLNSVAPLTGGGQKWSHFSADTGATAQGAGFISNGGLYGMKVGDLVEHRNTSTNITSNHYVISVNATTGAVDLTDATTVASGTNT